MRWQQPAARLARRGGHWGGRRRGRRRGRVPPVLCRAPPPRRVTFRRQRGLASGERAPCRDAGDQAGGKRMSPVGVERGEGSATGEGRPENPQDPAATPRAGLGVAAALPSLCLPDNDQAPPGPGRSGRASHADGEISRWGASSESIFIQPRNVSERLPGTAQYGEQSFTTVPEGGEQASAARRSGAAAQAESDSPHPRPPQAEASLYLTLSPEAPTRAEPGPPASTTHPYCFAHRE